MRKMKVRSMINGLADVLENYFFVIIILVEEPDVDRDEYLQQLADINEEEPPEMEEDEDEEVESEAKERIKNTIIDLFEEQIESILSLQVLVHFSVGIISPCHKKESSLASLLLLIFFLACFFKDKPHTK